MRKGLYKIKSAKLLATGEENTHYKSLLFREFICGHIEVNSSIELTDPDVFVSVKIGVVRAIIDKFNCNDIVVITHCNAFLLERVQKNKFDL